MFLTATDVGKKRQHKGIVGRVSQSV